MTFYYFNLYLKNETLYEFPEISWAPCDPKKNLQPNLQPISKHVDYFSAM